MAIIMHPAHSFLTIRGLIWRDEAAAADDDDDDEQQWQ